jgi:glycosyltransferase involved in cell wall biosynthesis
VQHIGLSLGRIDHWHDGLGEYSRQLASALGLHADALAAEGIRLHVHLPTRWHGMFGAGLGYLETRDMQRWWHASRTRFALWHILHQHNRYRPPRGTARVIETVHDLNFLHHKAAAKIRKYRARMARRLRQRDAIVAISQHVADDLRREFAQAPHDTPFFAPLHVIHNGSTDLSTAPQDPVPGIKADPPYLLHISRLAPSKNVAAMLDLVAAWPEQSFVFAGGASDYSAHVQRQATARALHNLHIALDVTEAQKAWLYAHCVGFLFPSLSEGFGLPPIEAMHFGKPVFLSRLTSLPEVGGDAAFYFDSFEAASMKAVVQSGLRTVHEQAGRREAIIARARHFTWARCAAEHLDLYRSLLSQDAGGLNIKKRP